jgi:hypothetical protein
MAFEIYQGKRPIIVFNNPAAPPTNDGPIKTALQSRIVIFWKGDSLTSTNGIVSGVTVPGSVGAIGTGKVGLNAIIPTNGAMSYRFNEYLRSLDQFSIGCWVYFNKFTSPNTYAGPWGSSATFSVAADQMMLRNNGSSVSPAPQLLINSGSNIYAVYGAANSWTINTWHYCLAEVDSINLRLRLWIDNNLIGEAVLPTGFVLNAGTDNFSLGGWALHDSTISNMSGRLEEVVILTGNTTSGERNWLWNSGVGNTLG